MKLAPIPSRLSGQIDDLYERIAQLKAGLVYLPKAVRHLELAKGNIASAFRLCRAAGLRDTLRVTKGARKRLANHYQAWLRKH
jgi:hypothetical protein